ncbi:MAG: hypothetical protein JW818_00085 [Pirellulales bacterium]|nr:hypothetical protein [Pirellulales bacterium]
MRRPFFLVLISVATFLLGNMATSLFAQEIQFGDPTTPLLPKKASPKEPYPWLNSYPMSFFTKTRSAKLVGKGHLSLCMKFQTFDYDARRVGGAYQPFGPDESYRWFQNTFVAKYGWAENHHLVLGVPYVWTGYHLGANHMETNQLGNVFLFDKWALIKETPYVPAVSFDTWIFFPTGDTSEKCGCDDTSVRFTTTVSKAFRNKLSLHFNPGYTINCGYGSDCVEINSAIIWTHWKKLWPAVEYNYYHKYGKGQCHDVVPGVIWKYAKGASFKLGVVINADSTMSYRDDVGMVMKFFYRF